MRLTFVNIVIVCFVFHEPQTPKCHSPAYNPFDVITPNPFPGRVLRRKYLDRNTTTTRDRSPSNIRDQQTHTLNCVAARGGYLYRLSPICEHQSERAHFKLLEFLRHSLFCSWDITHLRTFIDFGVPILLGLSKLSLVSAASENVLYAVLSESKVICRKWGLQSWSCQHI